MSEMSQGPGWWVASDGKWYPPHLHPSVPSPAVSPPASEAERWHETIRTFHGTAAGTSGPPSSWVGKHSKAVLPGLAVLLVLVAAVPTAIALSQGTSRPRRHTTATTLGAVATTSSTTTTSTTVAAGGPAPALTEAVAEQAFDGSWPAFALAFATGDEAGIDRYADTDVQEAIAGWFGCGCGPWPTAYQQVYMSAPPETSYPLSFLAEIQEQDYSHQPMVVEVVYSQQAAGAPWLISYLISYIDGPAFLDGSEMNRAAPASTFDISKVGGQFAAFFQAVFDTGKPPPTWPLTGSMAEEEQKVLAQRNLDETDGFHEDLSYTAGSHSEAFAIPGGDLMCGEIRSHSVMTPAPGGSLVQPADRSFFGQELATGSYTSVTSDGLRDACWNVTPGGLATPVSFMGGVYQRVGTPAG